MATNTPTPTADATRWPELMSAPTLATYLDASERLVWKLSASGDLPKPVKVGSSTRWRKADVDALMAAKLAG